MKTKNIIPQKEVPILIFDKPDTYHGRVSWCVGFSPLGYKQEFEYFNTKAAALKFARKQKKQPKAVSGLGRELPWDITVSWQAKNKKIA